MEENCLFPDGGSDGGWIPRGGGRGGGVKAVRNGNVWSTFVVPRLLHGIECQLLKKKEEISEKMPETTSGPSGQFL